MVPRAERIRNKGWVGVGWGWKGLQGMDRGGPMVLGQGGWISKVKG